MAATVLINAVSVAAGANNSPAAFALTPPGTGVSLEFKQSGDSPIFGCVLMASTSLDGTIYSTPFKVAELSPSPGNATVTRQVYHDAKNCVDVKYTVLNPHTNAVTVTLQAIQV